MHNKASQHCLAAAVFAFELGALFQAYRLQKPLRRQTTSRLFTSIVDMTYE